jgi:hypothetical protein
MKDQELAKLLSAWFDRHAADPNRWRNPVGSVVKAGVSGFNNWRNAPRGNPRAGFRAMKAKAESGS